ncbi:GntR family transcriptional regulator (plasmid) [Lichenicola cladoniae]|uniref:GntR family transcriptional regulator n=1 Tax=Lichenicola cladoniae TaxID=1484109 RepID=A0A6M8HY22_9PROT|nr:GntR family transcriptional regulator [Lichenicola cladoniae]NPD70426.1 GntR family transcriptional regulator [Acetobacteraceae bacterium]QKE93087.1 GntR family transcriptional regulator [Lichenicola cladoniae]
MSKLHTLLANRVIAYVRRERFPVGHHLTEQSLERVLGTSRSPVRGALAHLAEMGIVETRPPLRGYFLARAAESIAAGSDDHAFAADDEAYLALARDRLLGELKPVVTEVDLMRRYGLTRQRVGRLLDRIANEGWIERRTSKGWSFQPMIDGPRSYAESYELRRLLEPSAMMLSTFVIDSVLLRRLRQQQEALVSEGYASASHVELFVANATFHETLATLSGNRFIHQTIVRQNQLRRLIEYKEIDDRSRVRRQCEEHVAIIALLERGERAQAAILLEQHLANASLEKVALLTGASEAGDKVDEAYRTVRRGRIGTILVLPDCE